MIFEILVTIEADSNAHGYNRVRLQKWEQKKNKLNNDGKW